MISRLHVAVYYCISRPWCTKDGERKLKRMGAINQDRRRWIEEIVE